MESNPNEDYSKSSSEEETDTGTGRSYECVFCKRGFTTAQALGGHMNIHRKDRAKNRPPSSSSISDKLVDENNNNYYSSFRSFAPVQSYPTSHHQYYAMSDSEVHVNYQTFFPSPSTWDDRQRSVHTNNNNHSNYDSYGQNYHQHLNMIGDEIWRGNRSLRVGPSHLHADHDKEKREGVSEEDELDLELRLGHDP